MNESTIDREVALAISLGKSSDKYLWWAAFKAWKVCVHYQIQAVEAIAAGVGRDRSQVENWIHGYQMFQDFLSTGLESHTLHTLRDALSLTHFKDAWEMRNKYNLTNAKVYFYLEQCAKYHDSASQLRREIDAHENKSGNVATFSGYWLPRVRNWYAGALEATDTPQSVRDWLANAPDEVKG